MSKQLLPVYDKPMVHYPIATLMNAGIREILIITTPEDQSAFVRLLGDGAEFGVTYSYVVQERPEGLAQAFLLGEDFLAGAAAALVLGDNIFHGPGLGRRLRDLHDVGHGGHVFAYRVSNPSEYGVVDFDDAGRAISLEEKPVKPFVQLRRAWPVRSTVRISSRVAEESGPQREVELEITAVNQHYLAQGRLSVSVLPRGTAWLDTGTFRSLHAPASAPGDGGQAGPETCRPRGDRLAQRWIDDSQLLALAEPLIKSGYGAYVAGLLTAHERDLE